MSEFTMQFVEHISPRELYLRECDTELDCYFLVKRMWQSVEEVAQDLHLTTMSVKRNIVIARQKIHAVIKRNPDTGKPDAGFEKRLFDEWRMDYERKNATANA